MKSQSNYFNGCVVIAVFVDISVVVIGYSSDPLRGFRGVCVVIWLGVVVYKSIFMSNIMKLLVEVVWWLSLGCDL